MLTLVLVKTLDLNIKDGVRIKVNTLCFLEPCSKFLLVFGLDAVEFRKNVLVIYVIAQALKLRGVLLPALAYRLRDEVAQTRVAAHEPSAEGNTVCLVVEFVGIEIVEALHLGLFENLRVKCSNTINLA